MSLVASCLFIFFARVIDIGLSTIRILMLMRGKSILAAAIGFGESLMYILALMAVISNLDNYYRIVVYCLGFAAGNYVGCILEEKLAVGYVTAQVISLKAPEELAEDLRGKGFGVTILEGYGIEGQHQILHVLMKRKNLPSFMKFIRQRDNEAVVSILDARKIIGGYFKKIKAK